LNSIISWVGGKKALRDVILPLFPLNCDRYIEVFGGGAWILFHKPPNNDFEVLNDFNPDLTNMYRCVKEHPLEFINELGFLPLNGRDEFQVVRKFLAKEEFDDDFMRKELELTEKYFTGDEKEELKALIVAEIGQYNIKRAAAFFKVIRYSYASGCTSFGSQPYDIRKVFYLIWQANRRLKDVVIENKDFEAVIRQYNRYNSFFYCDPPYYETEGHYSVVFTKDDHARLRDALLSIDGKFMVSYNDCEFIRELYKGCTIIAVSRLNNIAQRYDAGGQFAEILIFNYDPYERRNNMPQQIPIMEDWNDYGKFNF